MEELKAPVAKKEAPKKETPKVEEVVAAAPAPEAEEAPKKKEAKGDDLKKIEGIGPKIAETLADAGIATYAELAKATPEQIAEIIADVRGSHVTDTWPAQAKLAAEGKWDELKEWQDQLDGGVEVAADDLTKIEGIGPKIAETLTAAGIATYAKLAGTEAEKIAEIIADVRGNHVTDTWPAQAKLAAEGKWDELQKWQDELDGGKE
ncbi:MAG: helix-hairpin-helix domain-containing protein [Chitinophagales bacterium]